MRRPYTPRPDAITQEVCELVLERLPDLPGADDFRTMNDAGAVRDIAAANEFPGATLSDADIADLVAFLRSLTDRRGIVGRLGVPETVPSGLPVPDL